MNMEKELGQEREYSLRYPWLAGVADHPRRRHDDFGPSYGFASLGNYYGQNTEGFWLWHQRRKAG